MLNNVSNNNNNNIKFKYTIINECKISKTFAYPLFFFI